MVTKSNKKSLMTKFVKLNDKKMIIFIMDSREDIINRISFKTKSLPKYTYIEGLPDEIKGKISIKSKNLFDISKKFNDFGFQKFLDQESENSGLSLEELTKLWIISHPKLDSSFGLLTIQSALQNEDIDFSRIYNDRKTHLATYEKDLELFKRKEEENMRIIKEFNKTKEVKTTKFELEKQDIEFILDLKNLNLNDIFNNIVLDLETPFATVNNFFKINTGLIPSENWNISLVDYIILKSVKGEEYNLDIKDNYKQFDDIYCYLNDKYNLCFVLKIGQFQKTNMNEKSLYERTLKTLGLPKVKLEEKKGLSIKGVFYFPKRSFNSYIFSDLVMNNPIFSQFIKINESSIASKKKGRLYLYFFDSNNNEVTANLTIKIMEKSEISMRGKSRGDFPIGEEYIRVKISRAKNPKSIQEFKSILSKLFDLYDNLKQEIIKEYKIFIKDFGREKKHKSSKKDLKSEKLFGEGYPRFCPAGQNLDVIEDNQIENYEKNGFQVLKFPRSSSEGKIRNFVCDPSKSNKFKDAKFPGLKKNKLKNWKHDYVPCCYTKDHLNDPKQIANIYFSGGDLTQKSILSKRLWSGNKRLPFGTNGYLPENLGSFFCFLDPDYMYIKKGMIDTMNSAIQCMEEALHTRPIIEDEENDDIENDDIENEIKDVRKELAKQNLEVCRQECYNFTTNEIRDYINNENNYFDPKLFIRLLETYYDCNIFIFKRDDKTGELVIPDHTQTYYIYKKERRTVVLFEHWGSEYEHQLYPQCELICRFDTKKPKSNLKYSFEYTNNFSKSLVNLFNLYNKTYILNKEVENIEDITSIQDYIGGQYIDNYGKCRFLKFIFKNTNIYIMTSPIPPLDVEEIPLEECIKMNDAKTVLDLLHTLKFKINSQTIQKNLCCELKFLIKNIKCVVSITPCKKINSIPIKQGTEIIIKEKSKIETYNFNKKIAKYIKSYLFYLFSVLLKENKKMGKIELIKKFIKEFIKVRKFDYKIVNYSLPSKKNIKNTSNGIMEDGKLIINSEEFLKRLIYTLRLEIERDFEKISKYYERKSIEDYFENIFDFKTFPNQVILFGGDVFLNWIKENKEKFHYLTKSILPYKTTPYFISNKIMTKDKIFLSQNTTEVGRAAEIGYIWKKDKYNPGNENLDEDIENIGYTLYAYKNEKEITILNKTGDLNKEISIAGYHIEGEDKFTSLLKL